MKSTNLLSSLWVLVLYVPEPIFGALLSRSVLLDDVGRVEGRLGVPVESVGHVVTSPLECAEKSIAQATRGFAVRQEVGIGYRCVPTPDKCQLPIGLWTIHYLAEFTAQAYWIPIIRRQDGSENFARNWADYKTGFGSANDCNEFWYGLEGMHNLTSAGSYGLRVEMTAWNGDFFWSEYSSVVIKNEAQYKYHLSFPAASYNAASTGGDALDGWSRFSTADQDNVWYNSGETALDLTYGWWWSAFMNKALPTGYYYHGGVQNDGGIYWYTAYNNYYSFKEMVMYLTPN